MKITKVIKNISAITGLIGFFVMSGCATDKVYKGTGIDKIPPSECAKCNKKPFYVDGKWLIKRGL